MERFVPLLAILVTPRTAEDRLNLRHGLRRLMAEDPMFRVEIEQGFGWARLVAMSERQLEVLVYRLRAEFKVEAVVGEPQVLCSTGLVGVVAGEGKYAAPTGGRGHYAHAKLRLGPGEPGGGSTFVNATVGGCVPDRFIDATAGGIRDALDDFLKSAGDMGDLRIELYDGSYHEADSSDEAFRIAGAMAFRDAAARVRLVVREPVMRVVAVVPRECVGPVIADLESRRAQIRSYLDSGGGLKVGGRVPLSELFGYELALARQTNGRGTVSMHFDAYVPVEDPAISDDDRTSPVTAPLRPLPTVKHSSVALPEPDDDSYAS
jgi:elongation factor G